MKKNDTERKVDKGELPEVKTTPNLVIKFGAMTRMTTKKEYIQTVRGRYKEAQSKKAKAI